MFKTVGVVSRLDRKKALQLAGKVVDALIAKKLSVRLEPSLAKQLRKQDLATPLGEMKTDLVIIIGGDGTILRTCLKLPKPEPPLLADPVTFATGRIGSYAVHVNDNDVAVLGARPRWFFAVLLLPEASASSEMAEAIMRDVAQACDALDVSVGGGHTEITARLDRPIVVGQMLGEVPLAGLIRTTRLSPGDVVLLTHGAAIEGTAIRARERRALLRDYLSDDVIASAEHLLIDPGISVVRAALTAASSAEVHAMHDPTGTRPSACGSSVRSRRGCRTCRRRRSAGGSRVGDTSVGTPSR